MCVCVCVIEQASKKKRVCLMIPFLFKCKTISQIFCTRVRRPGELTQSSYLPCSSRLSPMLGGSVTHFWLNFPSLIPPVMDGDVLT